MNALTLRRRSPAELEPDRDQIDIEHEHQVPGSAGLLSLLRRLSLCTVELCDGPTEAADLPDQLGLCVAKKIKHLVEKVTLCFGGRGHTRCPGGLISRT